MKTPKFTLKELLTVADTNKWTEAFGISDKRGKEIGERLEKIFREKMMEGPSWSLKEVYVEAANQEVAKNAREVAFVTYLMGCRVGEDAAIQGIMKTAKGFADTIGPLVDDNLKLRKDKDKKYVN